MELRKQKTRKINTTISSPLFYRIIQFATFTVFLGRGWQHWRWDAPYRALLWDESLMSGLVSSLLRMEWATFIHDPVIEQYIQWGIKGVGLFYFISAFATLFIKQLPQLVKPILWLGGISLIFLAILYCKERFFSIGQFFEYTLQFGSPFLLLYLTQRPIISNKLRFVVKLAIAATFIAHGLYALGYYPRPVHFMDMTMNILGLEETAAISFLNVAGILDIIISIGLFFPWRWSKYCLLYAIGWGFATTLARIWAHFHWDWMGDVMVQWLHESIMRFPHFLIPLAAFYFLAPKKPMPSQAS